ncbi:hypothetical protein CEXT_212111 [Caerostris extrusa]|uniref:Uncharacterized protein n=1 Tax=Caerostris extrusa TaxID=172846 RepID=A0AAV4ND11_CAEEX|nr:hypothetical protein CEXT_212111 [Caerostris extrusa]
MRRGSSYRHPAAKNSREILIIKWADLQTSVIVLQIKEKLFSVKTANNLLQPLLLKAVWETLEIFVKCDRAERMMTGNKYIWECQL